jgi:anaerobic glycerol-3-phosphate dehydrogenase
MEKFDVTMIGVGLAEMASSIHMVRAGLQVYVLKRVAGSTDVSGE